MIQHLPTFPHYCCRILLIVQGGICSRLVLGRQSLASQLDARGTTLPPRAGWCLWGRYQSQLKLVPRRQSPLRNFFSVFIKVAASENEVSMWSFLFIPVSFLAQPLTFLERTQNVGEKPHGRKSTNTLSFLFGVALLMLDFYLDGASKYC